ncbi:inositol monophosphatase [Pseudorhodobacter turbinis]|uniref:Inositol-1-monophosphatase n=1 Tax=Pseudorhodobacter turbinis TaxID=2500533 RepID=A0A4P8EE29_9RHOB|nr:inositol monophosphatase family protein [Pseudorhodobacter turbinis]QCO55048.1 inositol monophosphatase [Pseudorhodobacter turbinis]
MSNQPLPLTPEALARRADFCKEIALSAGKLALEGYERQCRQGAQVGRKGPQDFLTETDGAVEAHLRARLKEAFSEDDFLGEETGGTVTSGHVWVVDPIDGTANFARGILHFCISIAFVVDGVIEIGVIGAPPMDELYFARRGAGATRNGLPISTAATDNSEAACIELGWSNRMPQSQYLSVLTGMLDAGANVRRAASGALGLAYVADGRSDGYLELHMNSWDFLAGLLLVQEAGGVTCDFLGAANALSEGAPVLSSTPAFATQLSAISDIPLANADALRKRAV